MCVCVCEFNSYGKIKSTTDMKYKKMGTFKRLLRFVHKETDRCKEKIYKGCVH